MIDPGGPAPDFTLRNQDGDEVELSSLRGKWVVVYFYPNADTPGLHRTGVRDPRPLARLRGRERGGARRVA